MSGSTPPTEPLPTTPEPTGAAHGAQPAAAATPGPGNVPGGAPDGGAGAAAARRRGPLVAALVVAVLLLLGSVGATVAWATVTPQAERGAVRTWNGVPGMQRGMPGMHRDWDGDGGPYQGVQPRQPVQPGQPGQPGGQRGFGGRQGTGPGMHRGFAPSPAPSASATPSS